MALHRRIGSPNRLRRRGADRRRPIDLTQAVRTMSRNRDWAADTGGDGVRSGISRRDRPGARRTAVEGVGDRGGPIHQGGIGDKAGAGIAAGDRHGVATRCDVPGGVAGIDGKGNGNPNGLRGRRADLAGERVRRVGLTRQQHLQLARHPLDHAEVAAIYARQAAGRDQGL